MSENDSNLTSCIDCCICCDPLFCSGASVAALACGHPFHHHCITNWFSKKAGSKRDKKSFSCPVCRREVTLSHKFEGPYPIFKLILPASAEDKNDSTAALQELGELRVQLQQMTKKHNASLDLYQKLQQKEEKSASERDSFNHQVTVLTDKLSKVKKEANRVPELQRQNEKLKQENQKCKAFKQTIELVNSNDTKDTKLSVKKLLDVNDNSEAVLEQVFAINESNKRAKTQLEKQLKELQMELKAVRSSKESEADTDRPTTLRRQVTEDCIRRPLAPLQRKPAAFTAFHSGFEIDTELEDCLSKPAGLSRTNKIKGVTKAGIKVGSKQHTMGKRCGNTSDHEESSNKRRKSSENNVFYF
eukprot:Platyproteum_vivax@DN4409_c0_g1_i1.p1